MWDLTVPGNNDHGFYVVAAGDEGPGDAAVLVHNEDGCTNWSPKSVKTFGHTFSEHGSGAGNIMGLTDRARSTGTPQGRWVEISVDYATNCSSLAVPVAVVDLVYLYGLPLLRSLDDQAVAQGHAHMAGCR